MMVRKLSINISKYFFLFLFIGFFGSVTFFNHAHIVNGVTIIHSHPFKSDTNGAATHNHTPAGYLLIYFLINFIITAGFTLFAINFLLLLKQKFSSGLLDQFSEQSVFLSNSLRGPPAGMLIPIS